MTAVLEGIRVLDFGRYIAGPFCAALLGDLGADVIRIENREGGEDRYNMPMSSKGDGAGFLQWARGKRSVTLDLKNPAAREVMLRLVRTADIVVANLPPGTLAALGLDFASLQAIKPDIILVRATAYGSGGPYSGRVGFDGVAQAMSGNMHLTGPADAPMRNHGPYVDHATAAYTAFGALAALMHRAKTGEGQEVEGALLASALNIGGASLIEQALTDIGRVASGNRGQTAAPADCFATRDGWVLVQVVGNPVFIRWARLVGADEWIGDPRFASDESRGVHGELVSARMAAWCAGRTSEAVLAALAGARIPCGPVLTPQQVLEHAHVNEARMLVSLPHPNLAGPVPIPATPLKLSATPPRIRGRAPLLGEHTDEVLRSIGYSDTDIAQLRATGAI